MNLHNIIVLTAYVIAFYADHVEAAEQLKDGEYFIVQSWSQEKDFKRLYVVRVPKEPDRKYPVLIFLHGNGGDAQRAMKGFIRRHPKLCQKYVLVFAEGYQRSWNIVSERSKADDLGFVEAIVRKVKTYSNVRKNEFSVMGVSNGAALVNQLAIESRLVEIKNFISSVSPLNVWQHDGKNFKAKGRDNNYKRTIKPRTGFRLLNISGTDDRLVPYAGGMSRVIPAKKGKLSFVGAEESAFLWAKHLGHKGSKLKRPSSKKEDLEIFRYLDGDVIHYKVLNGGHGSTGAISEDLLLEFLEGS